MLNIVLFGPPGSGKGTQSAKLIEKYNLIHLSTGDILRAEIAAGSQLGLEAKSLMDKGNLVPDDVVIEMISNKIERNPNAKGFIFDGFPRTTSQAVALDDLLQSKHSEITMMLALEVSDEELTNRLLLRGKESGRSDDQNADIIKNRIAEYNNKTSPLKIYYSSQGKFQSVNGIGSIESIFNSLCQKIDAVIASEINESAFESSHDSAGTPFIHSIDNGQSHDDSDVMVEDDVIVLKEITQKPAAKTGLVKKKKAVSKKAAGKKAKKKKVVVKKKKSVNRKAKKKSKKIVSGKTTVKKRSKKVVSKKKSAKKTSKKKVSAKKKTSKKKK